MAPQTAISKAVCYKTKNEQLWEKAVHFSLVATNCFYAGLPTIFCTITGIMTPQHSKILHVTHRPLQLQPADFLRHLNI